MNRFRCQLAQAAHGARAWNCELYGSGDHRSRSHEAADRFWGLMDQASFSVPLGQVDFYSVSRKKPPKLNYRSPCMHQFHPVIFMFFLMGLNNPRIFQTGLLTTFKLITNMRDWLKTIGASDKTTYSCNIFASYVNKYLLYILFKCRYCMSCVLFHFIVRERAHPSPYHRHVRGLRQIRQSENTRNGLPDTETYYEWGNCSATACIGDKAGMLSCNAAWATQRRESTGVYRVTWSSETRLSVHG